MIRRECPYHAEGTHLSQDGTGKSEYWACEYCDWTYYLSTDEESFFYRFEEPPAWFLNEIAKGNVIQAASHCVLFYKGAMKKVFIGELISRENYGI